MSGPAGWRAPGPEGVRRKILIAHVASPGAVGLTQVRSVQKVPCRRTRSDFSERLLWNHVYRTGRGDRFLKKLLQFVLPKTSIRLPKNISFLKATLYIVRNLTDLGTKKLFIYQRRQISK